MVGRSVLWVLGSLLAVIALGAVFSLVVPDPGELSSNSQVLGRTTPQLLDLVAAVATGFAGAFALCRRDLSSILPGVAIAISLVPPLGVVGVCVGQGEWQAAFGAFVLFVSNVVALVIAGSIVFTVCGYARTDAAVTVKRGRAYAIVGVLLALVLVPLGVNTATAILVARWTGEVRSAAEAWIAPVDGATIDGIRWHGSQAIVEVRSPVEELPSVDALSGAVGTQLPDFVTVTVDLTVGRVVTVK